MSLAGLSLDVAVPSELIDALSEQLRVREADRELVSRMALLHASRNPNWIGFRCRKSINPRKNRPGRKFEHAEALLENVWHDAIIEDASRTFANEVDKALNG